MNSKCLCILCITADLVLNRLELHDLLQQEVARLSALESAETSEIPNRAESQDQNDTHNDSVSQKISNIEEVQDTEHNQSCSQEKSDVRNVSTDQDGILTETKENICDRSLQDLFNSSTVDGDITPTVDNRPLTSTQISRPVRDSGRNQLDVSEVRCSLTNVISKTTDLAPDIAESSKFKQVIEQKDEDKVSCGNDNEENGNTVETQAGKLVFSKPCDQTLRIRKQKNKNLIKSLKQKVDEQKDNGLKESSLQLNTNYKEEERFQHPEQNCSELECSPQTPSGHGNKISPSTLTKLKKFRKKESNVKCTDFNHEPEKNSETRKDGCDNVSDCGKECSGTVLSQSYDEKTQPQSKNIFKVSKDKGSSSDQSIDTVNSILTEKSQFGEGNKSLSVPSWLTKVNSLKSSIFKLDCEDNEELDDLNIELDFNPSKKVKMG